MLEASGLSTVEDILYHLPFRYEDRRQIKKIAAAVLGQEESFIGELVMLQSRFIPRRRMQLMTATLRDDTAALDLVWYRAPSFLVSGLAKGQTLLVHGKVERGQQMRMRIVHPDFEVIDAGDDGSLRRVLPVYLRPGGLPLSFIRKLAGQALAQFGGCVPNRLPPAIAKRQGLLSVSTALAQLHQPPLDVDLDALNDAASPAHRTIVFEELFFLQLGLGLRKHSRRRSSGPRMSGRNDKLSTRMHQLLPFKLTGAQARVLGEIQNDLAADHPMHRLVQGDVGSGKTMVAWLASLQVIEHGYQAVWMAPTEMLAEQHFRNLLNVRARAWRFSGAAHGVDAGARTQSFALAHRQRRDPIHRRHPCA